MRTDVEDLKRSSLLTDPRRLVQALGIDKLIKSQARGVVVCCPAHPDKDPSCSVRLADDGTVSAKCFSCNWTADALGLVAKVRGLDLETEFHKVLEEASSLAGVQLESTPVDPQAPGETEDQIRRRKAVRAIATVLLHAGRLDDGAISRDVCEYLRGRALFEEAVRAGCGALPPLDSIGAWTRMLGDTLGDEIDVSNLVRKGSIEWREHRLIIPWKNPDGSIDVIQRRRIDSSQREPRYVFPFELKPRFPFGIEALSSSPTSTPLVFVEGALDVLAFRALERALPSRRIPLGIPGIASWKGRAEWLALAKGRDVFVGFDQDARAEEAVPHFVHALQKFGASNVHRTRPRDAKDWADLAARLAKGAP